MTTANDAMRRPGFLVEEIHGILLTGGSAFGLDAAGGVQKYLEERGKGFDSRGIRIPIVPAGVIFDLHIGYSRIRPNKDMAYRACEKSRQDMVQCGLVGAGTGATVGKIAGMENAMSGGVGYASEKLSSGLIVSSLAVVNALGDVIDIDTHEIIAGGKNPATDGFLNTSEFIRREQVQAPLGPENTTLAVVMTNAKLNKMEINKVAQMAQNGLARVIRPAHTMFDGDLVFSLSCGELNSDVNLIGDMAAATLSQAIITAVKISNGIE